jgi:YHS domain-containing protein
MRPAFLGIWVAWTIGSTAIAGSVDEIPAAFLAFESMIGGWKGTAKPAANPLKGWSESHGWAWKFEKGKPVGLTLTLEGDKSLAKGSIAFDAASKKYKLDGVDPAGKPVAYLGSFGADGKTLTFDRVGSTPEGKERIIVRPNSNKIRYTLQIERQEKGAPQYKGVISVGLTKDGEAFAAGGGGADLPKCIMTGGAAGITVSYMGKSYPVCCTGCRDEFNDNPEKYAKLADLAAKATPTKDKSAAKPAAGKDDGSFDGLIDEPAPKKDDAATKATRELKLGQDLEEDKKPKLALDHYRTVVKDYPDTEAAKTAAARIKALGAK